MQHKRLEIIRLNPTGDAKRQIVCLAGRVSVFRARLDEELHLFGEALCGRQTAERFSVLLDGKSFDPAEHLYIGFESEPFKDDGRPLGQYLAASGVSEANIEPSLLEHGLGGLSLAPCNALNSMQQRMLQFIVALNRSDMVLVLNDPFFEFADSWREKFAREVAEHAWNARIIVVVVRLSTRPDVWIDNEYVSRIQLEKPREKTIGFGGGDLSSAEFVQALREELKKTAPQPGAGPQPAKTAVAGSTVRRVERPQPVLTAVPKQKKFVWQKPVQHAVLAACGLVLAIVLLSSPRTSTPPEQTTAQPRATQKETQMASAGEPAKNPRTGNMPPDKVDAAKSEPAKAGAEKMTADKLLEIIAAQRQQENSLKGASVLDRYPPEIKDAVLKAFREPKSAAQNLSPFKPHPVELKPEVRSVATNTAAPAPPPQNLPQTAPLYEPNTIMNPAANTGGRSEEEVEAQRQLLRQHFLEAVARARERQLAETGGLPLQR